MRDETHRFLAHIFQRHIAGQFHAQLADAVFQPALLLDFRHHRAQVRDHLGERQTQHIRVGFRDNLRVQIFFGHALRDGGDPLQIRDHFLEGMIQHVLLRQRRDVAPQISGGHRFGDVRDVADIRDHLLKGRDQFADFVAGRLAQLDGEIAVRQRFGGIDDMR